MNTINDIVPPSKRRDAASSEAGRGAKGPQRPRNNFPFKTLSAIVAVIIVSVAALFYFSSAKVDVTPTTISAAVQAPFTATQSSGDLPYEIVSSQKIASQSVQASGSKTVDTAASGVITVYNAQTKSQRLVTNTRFETTGGLIFRIHRAVTVPAGSASKPGTLDVTVYADKTGDAYNVAPTSFTLPGLAGTSLASKVYARSTKPMTGGASGVVPVIDSALETKTKDSLVAALGNDLASSIQDQVPTGYILLPGSTATTYQELTPTPSATTGMVDVKEQGTVTAIVFPNGALAKAIAANVSGLNYQGEPLSILSGSDLKLSTVSFPAPDAKSFSFTLSGTASLSYIVDPTRIAAAVAGKTRSAAEVALTNYPEIKRAVLTLRPFWVQSFPNDPSTITVTVANP